MLPLVEVPELVRHYAPYFASVFSAEALVEFERYISGLIVSENKTIEGINRLFVLDSRNQSSLNRLLTASPFSLEALNQARLRVLEERPRTQRKHNGVLSVDDTLLTHYGEHFDQIAVLRDPIQERFVWAHNLVTLHYSDEETDYPLRFRLWLPPDVDRLEAGLVQAGCVSKQKNRDGSARHRPSGATTCWVSGGGTKMIPACPNCIRANCVSLSISWRNGCKPIPKTVICQ